MKKIFKKSTAVILTIVMMLTIAPLSGFVGLDFAWLTDWLTVKASAETTTYSGTCGDNLTWSLDTETGVLDITGAGDMPNWTTSDSAPWYSYRSYIKFLNIGNSVTSIGKHAFTYYRNLISVIIGNSVTSIGNYAFDWCDSLMTVTIGNSVASIGACAFEYCDSLISVTIPDSVTNIGNYAFAYCDSITRVTIPDSVTSIGDSAFAYCDRLTSVTIGNFVTNIGYYAFFQCNNLERITVDTNNKYYSSDEYGVLFNKDKTTLIQYPMGNTRTTYTIPDSVTSIGIRAFYECDSLTSITIGNFVTSIENYAFYWCRGLTSITIPDSVISIGDEAFYACTGLTNVTIGNSVKSIGDMAFAYCYSLTSITIGNSVTSIGDGAFYDCDNLTNVTIPDSVASIGICAFYFCDGLTGIIIPDSVISIGELAFSDCENLEKITVDINNKYYSNDEYGVLFNEDKTTLIQYPNGSARTIYTIPDSVTIIEDYAFCRSESLTNVIISDSVTRIGNLAFSSCDRLTSVTIGNSVTGIGYYAFSGCDSLTSITIGNSVTIIGDYAFSDCDSLTDAYYFDTVDKWNKIKIGYSNELLINALKIPSHSHSYTSTVTKEATCTAKGIRKYTCICGKTYTEEIDKLNHSLTHMTVVSTCNAQGYEYDVCTVCGIKSSKKILPRVDHTWSEWKVSEEDEHVEIKECTVCHSVQKITHPSFKNVRTVTVDDFVVKYKDSYKLTPKVEADEGVKYEIIYKSSNPDVVTVDKDGNVTTKGRGIATIFCTVTDESGNEAKDACYVVVEFNWWQWIIWIFLWGWAWY